MRARCRVDLSLRGLSARRRRAPGPWLTSACSLTQASAEGGPLPSQGLTGLQLSNLMREFGLPPIVYRMGFLPGSGQEPAVPSHQEEDDPGTWDTRAIAVLCRFLNSGYPVLVGTHDHAFVIVGYRREIAKEPDGFASFGTMTSAALIYQSMTFSLTLTALQVIDIHRGNCFWLPCRLASAPSRSG